MEKSTVVTKVSRAAVLLLLLSLMTAMFTGCKIKKEAITAADFKSLAAEKGLQCEDATAQFAGYDFVQEVTLALPSDESYQIEFYVFDDTENAKSFFANNQAIFEESKSNPSSNTSFSGPNNAKYGLTSDGKYRFVEYVDNTAVYVDTDKANKSTIEEFVKAMGY